MLKIFNKDKDKDEEFRKEEFFENVYNKKVSPTQLDEALYFAIAEKLKRGVYEGFGGTLTDFEFGSVDEVLLSELRENIYLFSGAKTFQQTLEMSEYLNLPKNEFMKKANEIFDLHNKTYLDTEYDTAIGQAQNANKWTDIQRTKKTFPILQRVAVMDANTSPECRLLNEIVARVDDPVWQTRSPLTHFKCRCLIKKFDETEEINLTPPEKISEVIKKTDHINPIFKSNPGMSGEVFNKDHPYFSVPKKYQKLAENNFNLKIPKKD